MHNQTLIYSHLSWPTDWHHVFGRDAPLIIEIGFGNAQFLTNLGKQYPNSNILGLEISIPSLRNGEHKLEAYDLKNVRLLQANAQQVLWALCSADSVQALYINFPDPWPKADHQRRRLINDRFLHLAATRMLAGGDLYIATDHAEYAEWIRKGLLGNTYFESRTGEPFITENNHFAPTKYELKAFKERRTCYYFSWLRNRVIAQDIFPIPKELTMPHAVLQMPVSLDHIVRQFKPGNHASGSVNVHLIELFQSAGSDTLVIDTYILDEPHEQRIFLMIKQRQNGEIMLHLHDAGHPRSTSGVHTAINYLADQLCDMHPDAKVLRHNLKLNR